MRVFAFCLLTFALAAPAQAEIVRLTNGRTMTVESCAYDGNDVILNLYGGGMIRAPRSIVAELLPDEIPYARVHALEALAVSPTAVRTPLAETVIRELVDRLADDAKVDRRLVHALVRVESNYQPLAVSPKGAMGLMQLMPATARQYELDDAFDPEKNLRAGILHLKGLLQRFDISRALAAYNAGEGAVARYGGVPPYRETQEYVRRVLALYRQQ